jgi:hypothetical protein
MMLNVALVDGGRLFALRHSMKLRMLSPSRSGLPRCSSEATRVAGKLTTRTVAGECGRFMLVCLNTMKGRNLACHSGQSGLSRKALGDWPANWRNARANASGPS